MAFTMFAIPLFLSIYTFATYLQGADLCESIFFMCTVLDPPASFLKAYNVWINENNAVTIVE